MHACMPCELYLHMHSSAVWLSSHTRTERGQKRIEATLVHVGLITAYLFVKYGLNQSCVILLLTNHADAASMHNPFLLAQHKSE